MAVSDEVTNAELARQVRALRSEIHRDVEDLKRASAAYVLREVYASDARALEARMSALDKSVTQLDTDVKDDRKKASQEKIDKERERRHDRRIVIAAFLAAFLPLILELIRSSGSGP